MDNGLQNLFSKCPCVVFQIILGFRKWWGIHSLSGFKGAYVFPYILERYI